jgi:hypothetical protein
MQALCGALPVLATWDTQGFVDSHRVKSTVDFMLGLPAALRTSSLDGLGQLASVVLDRQVHFVRDLMSGLRYTSMMSDQQPCHLPRPLRDLPSTWFRLG